MVGVLDAGVLDEPPPKDLVRSYACMKSCLWVVRVRCIVLSKVAGDVLPVNLQDTSDAQGGKFSDRE